MFQKKIHLFFQVIISLFYKGFREKLYWNLMKLGKCWVLKDFNRFYLGLGIY
jgi:hypothetical protein